MLAKEMLLAQDNSLICYYIVSLYNGMYNSCSPPLHLLVIPLIIICSEFGEECSSHWTLVWCEETQNQFLFGSISLQN